MKSSVKLIVREGSEIDIQISEGNKSSFPTFLRVTIFCVCFIIAMLGSSAIYGAASGDYVIFNGIVAVTKSLVSVTSTVSDKISTSQ